jgi:hypothetical protein
MNTSLQPLRWIERVSIWFALAICASAIVYYFSMDWLQLTVAAVPWIVVIVFPYLLHIVATSRIAARTASRGAAITAMSGALLLLAYCVFLFPYFMREYTIFYLRWALWLSIWVLGLISIATFVITWSLDRNARILLHAA